MGNQQSTVPNTPTKGSRAQFIPAPGSPVSYGTLKLDPILDHIKQQIDLASNTLGTTVIDCSDEFFADADNLLKPEEAISRPGVFTENGAWMDGWETRRHNSGYDWAILRLGYTGIVSAFDIATTHFTGNHAPYASVEGTFTTQESPGPHCQWREVLPKAPLEANSHNYFGIHPSLKDMAYTHLRLKIYPDGGVARFRVYGNVSPTFPPPETLIDLAAIGHGGKVVSTSNSHFSSGNNLILPGKGRNMGDGWETRRSRELKHNDWVILRLGCPGRLERACIDTWHFKGNFPQAAELYACYTKSFDPSNPSEVKAADGGGDGKVTWYRILDREPLSGHEEHKFNLKHMTKVFTHVRMVIYPDGGVSRLRIWGTRDMTSPTLQAVPGTVVDMPMRREVNSRVNGSGGKKKRHRITTASSLPTTPKAKDKGKGDSRAKSPSSGDALDIGPTEAGRSGKIGGIIEDLGLRKSPNKVSSPRNPSKKASSVTPERKPRRTTMKKRGVATLAKEGMVMDLESQGARKSLRKRGKQKASR